MSRHLHTSVDYHDKTIYLVMRRLRKPIILLIVVYAISILGLVLIPGQTDGGEPYHISFFEAFYIISYTSTTIGFGEIPYPFTQHQRLWVLLCLYASVITWLYAIGKILNLIQDDSFREAVAENGFKRAVRRLNRPFYIVCGFGDTGQLLVKFLDQRGIQAVVVDKNIATISSLELMPYGSYTPGLLADARRIKALEWAGLHNSLCSGVVAITDEDSVNLKIAITVKLVRPNLKVICRAESEDAQKNMASFHTDYILNPFERFAERFALAIHSPEGHMLYEWLTELGHCAMVRPHKPPRGRWILCGYGRFGKAIQRQLLKEGIEVTVVEADPIRTRCESFAIAGRGTEADTLQQAGVESAVGVIAGTDDDTNNLSIIMTAQELNRTLFMVARQNRHDNLPIFNKVNPELMMQRSEIIARDIFTHLINPPMDIFLRQFQQRSREQINLLLSRLSAVMELLSVEDRHEIEREPWSLIEESREGQKNVELYQLTENWSVLIDEHHAPAVVEHLEQGRTIALHQLLRDPHDREKRLPIVALMVQTRGGERIFVPEGEYEVAYRDKILFFSRLGFRYRQQWLLCDGYLLYHVLTGKYAPASALLRWYQRYREQRSGRGGS
ncbi:potassium transporter TrkA [Ectothiorhodospiraceae bacterium BW-2]|nr:potassium transporter TrkA [Ectothiorhodospiraceae bacterium BW-2]